MSKRKGSKFPPLETAVPQPPFKASKRDEALVKRYFERELNRSDPGQIKIEKQEGREVRMALEPAVGERRGETAATTVAAARLSETFGGVTFIAADRLMSNLLNGTRTKDGVREREVNAALSLVSEIAPRDGIEAMLAVQMVNAHNLICELQRRTVNSVETLPQLDSNGGLLVKLLRTFTAQIETLKRYRTGGEQRVSVTHQHVTVNADRAAVAVNAPGGPGATIKTEEQPHEPKPEQLAYAPGDPLPREVETDGAALPEPVR